MTTSAMRPDTSDSLPEAPLSRTEMDTPADAATDALHEQSRALELVGAPGATVEASQLAEPASATATAQATGDTGAPMEWPDPGTASASGPQPIRRPKTLGDLMALGRPPAVRSGPRPSGPLPGGSLANGSLANGSSGAGWAANGSSGRERIPLAASVAGARHGVGSTDVAALDLALARVLEEDDATTAHLPVAGIDANDNGSDDAGGVAAPAERSGVETKPIPAIGPIDTARARRARTASAEDRRGDDEPLTDEDALRRFLRAARRGTPRVLWRTVIGQTILGLLGALAASTLLLAQQPLGGWLLALAALAVAGAGLAYALLAWRPVARFAPLALVAAHLSALAWACLLVGPRPALLVLVAPVVVLDLRAGGRWAALTCGTGAMALYVGLQVAATRGLPAPAFALAASDQTALDTGAVVVGLTLLLLGIIAVADGRERSDAAARARLYEVRLQRAQVMRLRGELERDGQVLDDALVRALRGRGIDPITLDGPLSLVAEDINAIADRLRTLQKDREDRLRLEGAIRALTRVLERARLRLPWTWPEASETLLDEVTALLRAPRATIRPVESLARPTAGMAAGMASGSWPTPATPPEPLSPPPTASWPPTIASFPGAGYHERAPEEALAPVINVSDLVEPW
ncbi:MAG TPA: hypothetical protein VGN32_19370 [Ktedonobacterales bacterium]|nr:hypothetical protein [Ktedonobacterales bacterium]